MAMSKRTTAAKSTATATKTKTSTKTETEIPTYDVLIKEHKTKSAVIRYLNSRQMKRADIARYMGIRYQHVRNVLVQDAERQRS